MTPRGAVRSETRVVQGGQGCHTVPARSSPYSVPAPTCARAGGQWYGHSPSMASTELHSITVAEPPAAKELPRGDLISALPSVGRVTAPLHVEPEGGASWQWRSQVVSSPAVVAAMPSASTCRIGGQPPPFRGGLWRNQTQGMTAEGNRNRPAWSGIQLRNLRVANPASPPSFLPPGIEGATRPVSGQWLPHITITAAGSRGSNPRGQSGWSLHFAGDGNL